MTTPATIPHTDTTPRTLDLDGRTVRYTLPRTFGAADAVQLYRHVLNDLLAEQTSIVLDCREAPYLDAKTLGELQKLSQRIVERRGRLVFDAVSDELRALLVAARFHRVFEIRGADGEVTSARAEGVVR